MKKVKNRKPRYSISFDFDIDGIPQIHEKYYVKKGKELKNIDRLNMSLFARFIAKSDLLDEKDKDAFGYFCSRFIFYRTHDSRGRRFSLSGK